MISKRLSERTSRMKLANTTAKNIFLFFALISVFTTIGIILSLFINSTGFFSKVSIVEFLTGTQWTPLFSDRHFGILPLVTGTLIITAGAAVISIPVGLCSAIYLSEYAKPKIRKVLKPFLEVLAGIPSIVYGYFALTAITPLLQSLIPQTEIFNAASGSIAVGIMTIPLVSSLSEDALRAVPDSLRHGALALGSTKLETSLRVVVPAAISGISASFVLAVSRAIGETMIVTIASGARPNFTLNPLESVQTMTAFIVQASQGDNPHGTTGFYALFAVGLVLFLITLIMNIISHSIVQKYRKEY
ncbi:MAG: phosphate ABC transporter permease subunit PstC [Ruminiclostridium sp.]|nr:phosphate ABC transporter permease subunit PstC [Ruminiclostridium sp.]